MKAYTHHLDYYRPGGPIFIYVSDTGSFTTEFLEVGLMHDIAIEAGAALITSDHRYFRSNLPTALVWFSQYTDLLKKKNQLSVMPAFQTWDF